MEMIHTIALNSAVEAGKEILKIYEDETYGVSYKADNTPITEADKTSNAIINGALSRFDIPIISEENKQIEFQERKHWDTFWMVDPLDGTKEFVNRNGEFTVNIALCKKGIPIFGVIYIPLTKELYYTDNAAGRAYKTVMEKSLANTEFYLANDRIQHTNSDPDHIRVVHSRSHMNADTAQFIEKLEKEYNEVEIISRGSSLKFCLLTEGKADIYPRFAPTMEWDTAAGHALCNAVGLDLVNPYTLKPLRYNKQDLRNPFFLVKPTRA